jgi:hypothetical protein
MSGRLAYLSGCPPLRSHGAGRAQQSALNHTTNDIIIAAPVRSGGMSNLASDAIEGTPGNVGVRSGDCVRRTRHRDMRVRAPSNMFQKLHVIHGSNQ